MEANVTVDVGKNIVELISKLANQLGVAQETIFPWYVNQQIIDGLVSLTASSFLMAISISIFVIVVRKFLKTRDEELGFVFFGGCIIMVVVSVLYINSLTTSIGKIINPHYFAMKNIVADISTLTK